MKRIVVALSGGVDSSVAAFLTKKYITKNLICVFLKNWNEPCIANNDLLFAKKIAKQLNIDFKVIDFSYEYKKYVFDTFIDYLNKGNISNPDILCNKFIKFKCLLNYSINCLKADYLVTGHYCGIEIFLKKFFICKSKDKKKDQTFFLSYINNKYLKKCIFPLYLFSKNEIRKIAIDNNLITACKKDSYGICFISNKNFRNFISQYIQYKLGFLVTLNGIILGYHNGINFYNINQRKGLCIGGIKGFLNNRWYLCYKFINYNLILVDQNSVFINYIIISNVNFFFSCLYNTIINIQIKNLQLSLPAYIIEIFYNKMYKLVFLKPLKSISNGQFISIFLNNICIAGGEIIYSFI